MKSCSYCLLEADVKVRVKFFCSLSVYASFALPTFTVQSVFGRDIIILQKKDEQTLICITFAVIQPGQYVFMLKY